MRELFAAGFSAFFVLCPTSAQRVAADPIAPLGGGSYTTELPRGAKAPPETIYRTANVVGKTPTNDWCSSLAWMRYSERQYPHPLAVQAAPAGLRVYYPGPAITANRDGIFGSMPDDGEDLVLGHSAEDAFPDARLDGFSDWFVSARFASGQHSITVTYGHGSPFVYALYEGGDPRIVFPQAPRVWSGDENSPVLGVTINGKPYGLFGPTASTWSGLKSKSLTNHAEAKHYFSLALLPDESTESLSLFKRYAYSHVADTRVEWSYDQKTSLVTTTFTLRTTPREGDVDGTLFALYPHQWRNAGDGLRFRGEYASVRGKMKLVEGTTLRTTMRFPGVLPALPYVGGTDKDRMAAYLKEEVDARVPAIGNTYSDGKWMGKVASLIPIAEQYGQDDAAKALRERLRKRLEEWFTAATAEGKTKDRGLFYYDDRWGTLIGYPASYGSDVELNDHHFHYGYFLRAAAEIARRDPAWAADAKWGGMVKLLIRDIADPDRTDKQFPFLRNFDPYAGHSWASGHAKFGDGNNQESSSEAMNAWTGLVLWGEATGDAEVRDLGVYLYTTEMNAIDEYWFDVHGDNFPKGYTPSVVTMVWGGKGANGTWFSAKPEHIHGINWLPIHGGSLYLGRHPDYVAKNYAALVRERGGTDWSAWPDLIWMYRALDEPADAVKQFEAAGNRFTVEGGDSKANVYHWIYSLNALGRVNADVAADYPLYAVFQKGKVRTYCVCNETDRPRTVTFSDGFHLKVESQAFAQASVGD
ncbi:MAG TPA: glycosyl hydrolase [Gemmataceae bacterium]|nr:glycosyl hydrolase [Gemmataceae bacterium]